MKPEQTDQYLVAVYHPSRKCATVRSKKQMSPKESKIMLNICGKPIVLVNTNLEPECAEPIKPFTA